jgi:hypothetical protein
MMMMMMMPTNNRRQNYRHWQCIDTTTMGMNMAHTIVAINNRSTSMRLLGMLGVGSNGRLGGLKLIEFVVSTLTYDRDDGHRTEESSNSLHLHGFDVIKEEQRKDESDYNLD